VVNKNSPPSHPRRIFVRCAGALAFSSLMLVGLQATAQTYPSKPIRIVSPYPPGGAADVISRIIGKRLSEETGQPVMVDNRPGAGGGIGTQHVAKSAPDGYTLLLGNPGPNAINPSLYQNLGYHAENDFTPIGVVVTAPFYVVVPATSPIKSVRELIAAGSSKNINFGSAGNGSLSHLGGEMFNQASGNTFVHVPYKGTAPLTTALMSGEVQWSFLPGIDATPHVKSGKLRIVAVASPARSSLSPETPTLNESGLPGFNITLWYGLLAPAKTPRPIVDLLQQKLAKILAEPEIKTKFHELSSVASLSTPEEFTALIKSDLAKYAQAAKTSGAKVE
jgi:tripartite-type tricarboxylate transporter receptor subunit TctC